MSKENTFERSSLKCRIQRYLEIEGKLLTSKKLNTLFSYIETNFIQIILKISKKLENKFKILQNSKINKFRPLNNHQFEFNGTGGIYRDFQKKNSRSTTLLYAYKLEKGK